MVAGPSRVYARVVALEPIATMIRQAQLEGRVKKGRVTDIDTTTSPDSFRVNGRSMPVLDLGSTIAVGDIVAYLALRDPIGLGKFIDS
jgi:hypothetical protein